MNKTISLLGICVIRGRNYPGNFWIKSKMITGVITQLGTGLSKYTPLDTSVDTLLYAGWHKVGDHPNQPSPLHRFAGANSLHWSLHRWYQYVGQLSARCQCWWLGVFWPTKDVALWWGGIASKKKFPCRKSSHRYSAVDPDLSIVLAFMTFYFLQNVQVESLHQSFKPAEKKQIGPIVAGKMDHNLHFIGLFLLAELTLQERYEPTSQGRLLMAAWQSSISSWRMCSSPSIAPCTGSMKVLQIILGRFHIMHNHLYSNFCKAFE